MTARSNAMFASVADRMLRVPGFTVWETLVFRMVSWGAALLVALAIGKLASFISAPDVPHAINGSPVVLRCEVQS